MIYQLSPVAIIRFLAFCKKGVQENSKVTTTAMVCTLIRDKLSYKIISSENQPCMIVFIISLVRTPIIRPEFPFPNDGLIRGSFYDLC